MNVSTNRAGPKDKISLGHRRWRFDHESQGRGDPKINSPCIADFVECPDGGLFHGLDDVYGKGLAACRSERSRQSPKSAIRAVSDPMHLPKA